MSYNEWSNKLWYIQTMEYYSAIKMMDETTLMGLKSIMLSKNKAKQKTQKNPHQYQKVTYGMVQLINILEMTKL